MNAYLKKAISSKQFSQKKKCFMLQTVKYHRRICCFLIERSWRKEKLSLMYTSVIW